MEGIRTFVSKFTKKVLGSLNHLLLSASCTFLDAPDKHMSIEANEVQLNVLRFPTDRGYISFRINSFKIVPNKAAQFIYCLFRRLRAAYSKRLNPKFCNFPVIGIP
jgi:hypothetical protein